MTIQEAAETGHRELLVALRDFIAMRIDEGVSGRDLVGLSRRLVDLAGEVRAIDAEKAREPGLRVVDETFDPAAI